MNTEFGLNCTRFESTCDTVCSLNGVSGLDADGSKIVSYNVCLNARKDGTNGLVGQCICVNGELPSVLSGFNVVGSVDVGTGLNSGDKYLMKVVPSVKANESRALRCSYLLLVVLSVVIY